MKWFMWSWWCYLLAKSEDLDCSWLQAAFCRARGHPNGVWWYSVNGDEPDMHCKICGDDLG